MEFVLTDAAKFHAHLDHTVLMVNVNLILMYALLMKTTASLFALVLDQTQALVQPSITSFVQRLISAVCEMMDLVFNS